MIKRITVIIILLLLSLAFVILDTRIGLNLIAFVIEKLTPPLTIEKIQGKLIGPINIINLNYRTAGIHVHADNLKLSMNIPAFFSKKLDINSLTIHQLSIERYSTTQAKPFALPIDIILHDAQIQQFNYADGHQNKSQLQQIVLSGKLYPRPIRWDFTIKGQHIASVLKNIKLNGLVNFLMHTTETEINFTHIDGRINQRPLYGLIHFHFTPPGIFIDYAHLNYDDAKLAIQGGVTTQWSLKWNIVIPNFSHLDKRASGRFSSSGSLLGTQSNPEAHGEFAAHQIKFLALTINEAQGHFNINLKPQGKIALNILGRDINYQDIHVKTLSANTVGNQHANTSLIKLIENGSALSFTLNGSIDDKRWQGNLEQLIFQRDKLGIWRQQRPAELSLATAAAQLKQACFSQDQHQNEVCTNIQWEKDKRLVANTTARDIAIHDVLTALTDNYVKAGITTTSKINLSAQITRLPHLTTGFINASLSAGTLSLDKNNLRQTIAIQRGNLQGHLDARGFNSKLSFQLSNRQLISGEFYLPNFKGTRLPLKTDRISGSFRTEYSNLALLDTLIPQIANSSGNLHADIHVTGTVAKPQLSGTAIIRARTQIPALNIDIKNIVLTLTGNQNGYFNLTGQAQSGPGIIYLNGKWDLNKTGLPAVVNITGSNFLAVNTSEYKIIASPKLILTNHFDKIIITGDITIPKATIIAEKFREGSHTLSNDVVFVGRNATPPPFYSNLNIIVRLIMGNNVAFSTHNVTGLVNGDLTINYKPTGITTANGQLNIANGKYNMQGETLTISTGKLIYTGGRLDNPGLNILATRSVLASQTPQSIFQGNFNLPSSYAPTGYVTVGVNVTGTMKRHVISLFSDPAIYNQSDILSLLLAGKPANQIQSNNAQILMQAASSLNLGGSSVGSITQELRHFFGLDELGVASTTIPEASTPTQLTSLVLGKRIADRLFINYSMGLLDPIGVLSIRYQLTNNWNIQSNTSSQGSGIDLFYTIEK